MFGKVKKWLGIEGAKLEIIVPEEVYRSAGTVTGKIRFFSMSPQKVKSVRVVLKERYSRGRRKNKLTDEYELGEITLNTSFTIPVQEVVEIDFSLPFKLVQSEMDEIQNKNILTSGLVKTAKWISGVKSTYRIEAEAKVEGVALNPFDKKEVKLV